MSSGSGGVLLLAIAGAWLWFGGSSDDDAKPQEVTLTPAVLQKVAVQTNWDDSKICTHAVQTYFFLPMIPRFVDWKGPYGVFESDSGNLYACTTKGDRAVIRWVNSTGEEMYSESTRYSVGSDGKLYIKTDMMEMSFD